jgi:hypothetical protein
MPKSTIVADSDTLRTMKVTRIAKIAGLSVAGFCLSAAAADKVNLNPVASQLAGFAGAFLGTLFARRRTKPTETGNRDPKNSSSQTHQ